MRRSLVGTLFTVPLTGLGLLACLDSFDPAAARDPQTGLLAGDSVPSDSTLLPLTLIRPEAGARIAQNDATLGCSAHPYRGYGFRWDFVWSAVESAAPVYEYSLFVQHKGSVYPAVSALVSDTAWSVADCNAFVIDRNADDWYWLVQAWDSVGTLVAASDTGWFGFQSCLLANGQHCYAPPEPAPLAPSAVRQEKRGTGVERP